jgi:hypothetical protein
VLHAQRLEQLRTDRDRPRLVADQLGDALRSRWTRDIVAQRIELGAAGDDALAALGQQIVKEERGIRPLGLARVTATRDMISA